MRQGILLYEPYITLYNYHLDVSHAVLSVLYRQFILDRLQVTSVFPLAKSTGLNLKSFAPSFLAQLASSHLSR